MKALITGASSGLGRDLSYILSNRGYDLILVARRKDRMEEIAKEVKTNVRIIEMDLAKESNLYKLYDMTKDENIDILINNAGFGLFGHFADTDLDRELEMINVNIKALHVLTKLFLKDMVKNNRGRILNVSSMAGFLAGPTLNTYYATKNYVLKLTEAIYEELRQSNCNVHISALCPGPFNTEFNKVANGKFTIKGMKSIDVATYGIEKMFKNKLIIIPGITNKLGAFAQRFICTKLMLRIVYNIQKKKNS